MSPGMDSGAPLSADAMCGVHPDARAAFACGRCGTYACPSCAGARREGRSLCRACAEKEPARTKWWQGTAILIVGGIAAQIAGGIAMVVGAAIESGGQADLSAGVRLSFEVVAPAVVLTGITMLAFALALPLITKVRPREALGLRGAPWPAFIAGPLGIVALGPTSDAVRRLMVQIAPNLTLGTLDDLEAITRAAPLWAAVPLFALVPGICEEALFRGAFQRSIRLRLLAIPLSGVLFAVYHADPHHIAAVVPLGLYLAWLGDRTNSLFVPISAHVTNNAIAVVASKLLDASADAPADPWWFVPVGWIVAALAAAVVWWSTRRTATASG
jgi:membrane protease YdiL (CAAX protease family)